MSMVLVPRNARRVIWGEKGNRIAEVSDAGEGFVSEEPSLAFIPEKLTLHPIVNVRKSTPRTFNRENLETKSTRESGGNWRNENWA